MRSPITRHVLAALILLCVAPNPLSAQIHHYKQYSVHGVQPLDAGAIAGAELGVSSGPELIVSGLNANGVVLTQLYSGGEESFTVDRGDTTFSISFSLVTQTLEQVWLSRSVWHDLDGDGDHDLVLAGARNRTAPYNPITAVYLNDRGTLARVNTELTLPGIYNGALAVGELYGDGRSHLVYSGLNAQGAHVFGVALFSAVPNPNGTPGLSTVLTHTRSFGLSLSALALGDCDADGDLDVALSGLDESGIPASRVYRNTGDDFVEVVQTLPGIFNGGLAFGDVEGDGDSDLVLTGAAYGPEMLEGITALYRSQNCVLTEDPAFSPPVLAGNTAVLADHDADGDLDMLLNGIIDNPRTPTGELNVYLNDGSGTFTLYARQAGALYVNATWLDLNADGFLDPVVGGSRFGVPSLLLYRKPGLPQPDDL